MRTENDKFAAQKVMNAVQSFTRSECENNFTLTLFKGGAPGIGYRATAHLLGKEYAKEEFHLQRGEYDAFWRGYLYIRSLMDHLGWQPDHPLQVMRIQLYSPFYRAAEGPYCFNENGVCTNPDEIILADGRWTLTVRVAQTPKGRWGVAHSFNDAGTGGYTPLCCSVLSNHFTYKNRQEALQNYYLKLIAEFAQNKALIKQLRALQVAEQQLSLFAL